MTAVVVFSGGQDSTTCLFWAKQQFDNVVAVNFHYGQRHAIECAAARQIAHLAEIELVEVELSALGKLSKSALTRADIDVAEHGGMNGLPSTFVPGRNLVFLSLASSFALSLDSHDLVAGVCQTDFSGYPDCRRETIDAMEKAIRLGNDCAAFTIHTPLMFMTKAATVELAMSLPGCLAALAHSVTCYQGKRPGCGVCPACALRAKGFSEAGIPDPANG